MLEACSVLKRVAFGLKCVLHRVRVSQCRPSMQGYAKSGRATPPPPGNALFARFNSHLVTDWGWIRGMFYGGVRI